MRPIGLGAVLVAGLILTACTIDKVAKAVLPASADFAGAIVVRGCGDNPYLGKSPVETLALATTYTAIATTGYTQGLVRAQEALGLQRLANSSMVATLDDIGGDLGLGALFTSYRMIRSNAQAAEEMAREIERHYTERPLPEPVEQAFREAARSLHIGNRFQVDAALGTLLMAGYVSEMRQSGGSQKLAGIMVAELGNDGGRQLLDSMLSAPGTVADMALNIGKVYTLNRTLNDVTDFSVEAEALEMLGIEADIAGLEAAAQARAHDLRRRYPAELAVRPSGETLAALLVSALTRNGVNNEVASLAVHGASTVCGGLFSTAQEATPTRLAERPAAPAEPTAARRGADAGSEPMLDLLRGEAFRLPGSLGRFLERAGD